MNVRLRSLTEQANVKIRVKIPARQLTTSEFHRSLVSIVKRSGSHGDEARIIEASISDSGESKFWGHRP